MSDEKIMGDSRESCEFCGGDIYCIILITDILTYHISIIFLLLCDNTCRDFLGPNSATSPGEWSRVAPARY